MRNGGLVGDRGKSEILVAREDSVVTVTLNRPTREIPLTPALFAEPGGLFEEIADNPGARVMNLNGRAKHFGPVWIHALPDSVRLNQAGQSSFEESLESKNEAQALCLGTRDVRAAMAAW